MGYFGVRIGPFSVGGYTRPFKPQPIEWPRDKAAWIAILSGLAALEIGGRLVMAFGPVFLPAAIILMVIWAFNVWAYQRRLAERQAQREKPPA